MREYVRMARLGIGRAYRWVRDRVHPDHRYHVVDTGLEPGYHDPDTVLLYAAFACLDRYIEESEGTDQMIAFANDLRAEADRGGAEWAVKSNYDQAKRLEEAAALYVWWHSVRPAGYQAFDRELEALYGGRSAFEVQEQPDGSWINVPRAESGDMVKRRKALDELECQLHEDDQAMLHRLITLRPHLWT